MNLFDRISFKTKVNKLKNIPDINCGGCGIATLAMYRYIKQNFNIDDIKMICWYDIYDNDYITEHDICNNNCNIYIPTHIGIKLNNTIEDLGFNNPNAKLKFEYNFNEVFLVGIINNPNCNWNYKFGRGKYLPAIEEIFNISLADIVAN